MKTVRLTSTYWHTVRVCDVVFSNTGGPKTLSPLLKRSKLIQTITLVMPIADELRQQGLIHPETYNKIQAARTSQDQMRKLYNVLTTTKSKSSFYRILQEIEPQACESM
uniref:CARD domain-containing protein n=1 Tax=Oreochromis aureus TaxID=47969 RepID=A0A668RY14_OREAU